MDKIEELNKELESLKEEVLVKEGKETKESKELTEFQKFVTNPDNKKDAFEIADVIQERVGKNWFSLRRVMRKTGLNKQQAEKNLYLCEMFGYLTKRVGTFKDGKKNIQVLLFKIILNKQDKILSMKEKASVLEDELQKLREEIVSLER